MTPPPIQRWMLTSLVVSFCATPAYCNLRAAKRQLERSTLPDIGQHLASLGDASVDIDTPFFWHVPKAGGTSMQDFFRCLNLVIASEVGVTHGHENDETLHIVDIGTNRYVNVDTISSNGIAHAKEIGFPGSRMADVVISTRLIEAAENLFNDDNKGVLFTLLRHPVDRAVSLFYYLQDAYWENTYAPQLANMTLEEYEKSGLENNWMVRILIGKQRGPLEQKDLAVAKNLLREKCIVGLMSEMEQSVNRFGEFLGWKDLDEWGECISGYGGHASNSHKHPPVEPGSNEWKILVRNNLMDLELYEYAVDLFQQQGATYFPSDGSIE